MGNELYLLTGATGLLGSNLVWELTKRGQRIRALVMQGDKAASKLPKDVEITEGDLLDNSALERFFMTAGDEELIVLHAAGIVTMDPNPNEKVRLVNVEGTRNIVENCLRYRVKKLVYVSSTSVLPEKPHGQAICETEQYDPEGLTGYYAKTKAMATEIVISAARERDLDASVVYPSGIFGPNDLGFGMITSCVKMVAEGKLPVSIGGTFNSVDARDLAGGILACAEKGEKGRSYIMASRCYTFGELMHAICSAAGVRKPLFTVPLWLIRPFSGFGTLYGKLTKSPAWFSRYTVYNLERNNDYSAERAKRELGFSCRPLEESIADTVEWLIRMGKLSPSKSG